MKSVRAILNRIPRRQISNYKFETEPIAPKMWYGDRKLLPFAQEEYTIDVTNEHMMEGPEGNPALAKRMLKQFEDVGLVLMRGQNELGNHLDVQRDWAKVCMPNLAKYEGGANPRAGKHVANVYEVGAPKEAWLHYHHEMQYIGDTVRCLGFCATDVLEPTAEEPLRGASYVSCNLKATDDILKTELGQKLKEKGVTYIRCLTDREEFADMDGVYNHWQMSFGTEDPAVAQKRAEAKGLVCEWGENRYLKTKFTVSSFEYYPRLDRNLLYSSIADHGAWFDTWPGMSCKNYMSDYEKATAVERPLAMTYGDGTEFTLEDWKTFVDVYDRHGIPIQWQKGDIAVVCNYRFAHGRLSYDLQEGEKRELGVILGEMKPRTQCKPGKW